jgi:hypothetical protein
VRDANGIVVELCTPSPREMPGSPDPEDVH